MCNKYEIVGYWEIIVDGTTYYSDRLSNETTAQAKAEAIATFNSNNITVIKH